MRVRGDSRDYAPDEGVTRVLIGQLVIETPRREGEDADISSKRRKAGPTVNVWVRGSLSGAVQRCELPRGTGRRPEHRWSVVNNGEYERRGPGRQEMGRRAGEEQEQCDAVSDHAHGSRR